MTTKTLFLLPFIILFTVSCKESNTQKETQETSIEKPAINDLTYEGMKGQVKTHTTRMYSNVEKKNGVWVPKDTSTYFLSINKYDENGMLTQNETYYVTAGEAVLYGKSFIEHNNGGSEHKAYDKYGDLVKITNATMINKYKYRSESRDSTGKKTAYAIQEYDSNYKQTHTELVRYFVYNSKKTSVKQLTDWKYSEDGKTFKATIHIYTDDDPPEDAISQTEYTILKTDAKSNRTTTLAETFIESTLEREFSLSMDTYEYY